MPKIYVLYHAHCTDGTGAKYAAWKKFGDEAQYIPVQYGKPIPEMEKGSRIFIVDFSYSRDILNGLIEIHQEVIVLDHHKTAEADLKDCPGCHFDMNKSGAVLAWEYFHPTYPVPNLLLDIQDRDLWKFKRDFPKQVHAGLQLTKGDMELWDQYATNEYAYDGLVEAGQTLLLRTEIEVKNSIKKTKIIPFLGHRVGIINTGDYQSEIGNAICLDEELGVDFAICYVITTDNNVLFSLRSEGDFDVSEVAKKFGGGGHKNAAGCRVTLEMLCKFLKGNG